MVFVSIRLCQWLRHHLGTEDSACWTIAMKIWPWVVSLTLIFYILYMWYITSISYNVWRLSYSSLWQWEFALHHCAPPDVYKWFSARSKWSLWCMSWHFRSNLYSGATFIKPKCLNYLDQIHVLYGYNDIWVPGFLLTNWARLGTIRITGYEQLQLWFHVNVFLWMNADHSVLWVQ